MTNDLSANLIHGPLGLHEVSRVDAVAWLFGADAVPDELGNLFIFAAAAEEGAGIPLDGREQAVADFSFGGDS